MQKNVENIIFVTQYLVFNKENIIFSQMCSVYSSCGTFVGYLVELLVEDQILGDKFILLSNLPLTAVYGQFTDTASGWI